MLGERHGGKPRIRLLRQLTRLRGSKEGQDIIWHAARFPKRLPPINTNGTAGIRISKRAQGSTRQFRPPRQRLHGLKGSVSTRPRQRFCPIFAEASHLTHTHQPPQPSIPLPLQAGYPTPAITNNGHTP